MLVKNEMRNMQNGTDHTRNAKMNSEKKKGTDYTRNAKKKSGKKGHRSHKQC